MSVRPGSFFPKSLPQPSFSVQCNALFPSVADGILVLTPESHRTFVPCSVCFRFDVAPVHFPVTRVKAQFKAMLVGRAVLIVLIMRCRKVRLIMVLESQLVFHELVEGFFF